MERNAEGWVGEQYKLWDRPWGDVCLLSRSSVAEGGVLAPSVLTQYRYGSGVLLVGFFLAVSC